jgi:hypothetical protein
MMETKKDGGLPRSCLPTATTAPSATSGDFGTSPLQGSQTAWQAISLWQHVANSKDCCPFITAVAGSIPLILSGRIGRSRLPWSLFFYVQEACALAQLALIGGRQQIDQGLCL